MKISKVEMVISAVRKSQYPIDNKPEFLLVGRSNVGKSSFINALVNRKNLAKTSSTPGKTQTLNFYRINDCFYLVDVPGYGFARVSKQLKSNFGIIIENYLETRENLKRVFMLVDFRHKPTDDDVLMYNFLTYYKIPVTVVATKCDKVKNSLIDKNKRIIIGTLGIDENDLVVFSAVTKKGKDKITGIIENIL